MTRHGSIARRTDEWPRGGSVEAAVLLAGGWVVRSPHYTDARRVGSSSWSLEVEELRLFNTTSRFEMEIRYDTIEEFNVDSKATSSQIQKSFLKETAHLCY